jgi:maltooligosyltrehalose trehalohydrolase
MGFHEEPNIGACYRGNGQCTFTVWAPFLEKVALRIISPQRKIFNMTKDSKGYWKTLVRDVYPGTRYLYGLNDAHERPDPASCFQPGGVHGASEVIDHSSFRWKDENWRGIPLHEMIIYELHVGTFTAEGSFEAIIPRLDELKGLGINAVEMMPIAQFPGERNWGYDGTCLFAVQNSYGATEGLKNLVNICHEKGLAVILDVVYNHLGPEGNYLRDFGPYFTSKYRTPWGDAVNFDDAFSDGVRLFFIENALHWFRNYHIDALRIDAVHGITDMSAVPFLQELSEAATRFSLSQGRRFYLFAESDLNDTRIIRPKELGGFGIDAQWCDDFHHAVHTLLTGETQGYYADFGRMGHLVKALREGYVYSGEYSEYRTRNHGNSSKDRPAGQFVVFSQNHDQVGNRMAGERLSSLVSFESLKLAAGITILSPFVPLLFMGEEYAEDSSFLYFISHSDPGLIESVRKGRKEEFKGFEWHGESPDPQSEETFLKSKLKWEKRYSGYHRVLLDFYKQLIGIRRGISAFAFPDKDRLDVCGFDDKRILVMRRWSESSNCVSVFNFNKDDLQFELSVKEGGWEKILDSAEEKWHGPGTALPGIVRPGDKITMRGESFAVFLRKD